jgi:hypothetical protein
LAEEFVIKSQQIEDKINQLLPSQGGFQPGVDFSASTMVIPIVDLTETAEGSSLRQDLQTSLSLNSVSSFNVSNTTTNIVSTTGYFRVFGNCSINTADSGKEGLFAITDGSTTKTLIQYDSSNGTSGRALMQISYDFTVFLQAGDTLQATTDSAEILLIGCTRQVADLQGNLVNP